MDVHLWRLATGALFLLLAITLAYAIVLRRQLQSALTDSLTRLPVRRVIMERILRAQKYAYAQSEKRSQRNSQYYAVILFDVVGFKRLNDKYGQEYGNMVLHAIAAKMQSVVTRQFDLVEELSRELSIQDRVQLSWLQRFRQWFWNDVMQGHIGRYGGDEFLVVYPGARKKWAESKAREICEAVAGGLRLTDGSFRDGVQLRFKCGERRGDEGEVGVQSLLAEVGLIKPRKRG